MRQVMMGILALAVIAGGGPASAADAAAHAAGGAFEPAGTLKGDWVRHVAAPLPDGRVLVVGGTGRQGVFDAARAWDPSAEWLGRTAPLEVPRTLAAGVTLPDGGVLIVGGDDARGRPVLTAELWDPDSGTFSPAGKLEAARIKAEAILLADGRVAVIGGSGPGDVRGIEVWDPQVAGFRTEALMPESREDQASVLLPDGRVLITGGDSARGPLSTALLWDPVSGEVVDAGQMRVDRYDHTATLLPDGRVIVIGGWTERGRAVTPEAEIWDPATNGFEPAGTMAAPRASHTATRLPDGRILVVGGGDDDGYHPIASEIWDHALGRFVLSGPLAIGREGHSASLLPDGRVLVVGGRGDVTGVRSPDRLEVWDPAAVPVALGPPASLALAACASDDPVSVTAALLEQFPVEIEGMPLEALACDGPGWLAMHDPADAGTATTIERARALAESGGRSIDDLTVATALHGSEPGRVTRISALRVDGLQAERIADLAIALLLGIERPDKRYRYLAQGRIPVTDVRDATIPGSPLVTVYTPVGDTVWFLGVDEPELLEQIAEALPGPGGRYLAPELGIAITFPQEWIVSPGVPDGREAPSMGPDALLWHVAHGRAPDGPGLDETCGLSLYTSTDVAPEDAFGDLPPDFQEPLPDRPEQERPVPEVLDGGLLRVAGNGLALGGLEDEVSYVLGSDEDIAELRCMATEAPADQWLSLAKTIEFLSATE